MNEREIRILTKRLLPLPISIRFSDGEAFRLDDRCRVVLRGGADPERIAARFRSFWGITPNIAFDTSAGKLPDGEAYRVRIAANGIFIDSGTQVGAENALKTLRQLAEARPGVEKLAGYILEPCEIDDAPALSFRGVHLCIFPETPLWDIEKKLRLAARFKFNYAVVEFWGTFPFTSHPDFGWSEHRLDRAELKRLLKVAADEGITLIPQCNVLGHASGCRIISGKHCVLDHHPEYEPLFEPDGWCWCLTNPATRRILADMVTELHDFFGAPPFFHLGFDEADGIASCRECRKHPVRELVIDHLRFFRELLASRHARPIIWHDMLVDKGDARWRGYTAHSLPENGLSELYRELPRDVIIADWQYGFPCGEGETEPSWPTVRFFAEEKFDVLVSPWLNVPGTKSLGKLAAQEKLFGMLATTWHISHHRNLLATIAATAVAAWNPEASANGSAMLARQIRGVCRDMGIAEYEQYGFCSQQVDPGSHPHELK
jgi:hypothetical protein